MVVGILTVLVVGSAVVIITIIIIAIAIARSSSCP